MMIKTKLLIFIIIFTYCHSVWAVENNQNQEMQALKQQVKLLLERVNELEKQQKNTQEELVSKSNEFKSKTEKSDGLTWEVGGYAKLDAVFNSTSAGANTIGDEFIVNALIPNKDSSGEDSQLKITARESRIWVKTGLPFTGGHFKTYIEGDFFGNKPGSSETLNNNADFRLREAYGHITTESYGNFLFGQAWTTFQNLSAFPHMTTLGILPGQIFNRVPQIRWTYPFSKGSIQLSLENPESNLRDVNNNVVRPDDDAIPDAIARINWKEDWGNVSLAGLVRELRCHIPGTCDDDVTGWGISTAGRILLPGKDNLRFQANWGDGIGRFVSGTVYPGAIVNTQGNIESVEVKSMLLSYQHWWSERWSSALIFNVSDANNLPSNSRAIEQIQTYHVNLLWWPLKRVRFGVELLHAESQLVNDEEGELTRVTFSSKFIF